MGTPDSFQRQECTSGWIVGVSFQSTGMDTMRVLMFDFRLEFDCGALMLPVVYTRFQPCPVSQGLRKRVFNVGW